MGDLPLIPYLMDLALIIVIFIAYRKIYILANEIDVLEARIGRLDAGKVDKSSVYTNSYHVEEVVRDRFSDVHVQLAHTASALRSEMVEIATAAGLVKTESQPAKWERAEEPI